MYHVRLHDIRAFGVPLFRASHHSDDVGVAALMTSMRKFNRRQANRNGNRSWNRTETDR